MTKLDVSDRRMLTVGALPLVAATLWLVALREPKPVAAAVANTSELQPREQRPSRIPARRFLGVIVAGREADLAAELTGQVVTVFVQPGAHVRRGQALLELKALSVSGVESIAHASAAESRSGERAAELAAQAARDKAERMEQASSAYPAREIRAARLDATRAQAELEKLRAGSQVRQANLRRDLLRAEGQTLRAPFDGVLASRWVDEGDSVTEGAALARVLDEARAVRFAVPSRQLAALQLGAALEVSPHGAASAWHAKLVDVEPELDAASGFGVARAELNEDAATVAALVPGARVDVIGTYLAGANEDD